jgi:phage-related baseplate assembly protein
MADLPIPVFVEANVEDVLLDLIDRYQTETGTILQPAQIEQLILNVIAYRTNLNLIQMNLAGRQGLIDYSTFPILDYLCANFGVERLASSEAVCRIRFTLVSGHGVVTIPAGIRIQSIDGLVFFTTDVPTTVQIGVDVVDIDCTCNIVGEGGNNYAIDTITIILDPQPYLSTATNIEISGGGSNSETDEQLRARYKLRLSTFSTAGARNAYKFYARSVSPSIVDVAVQSPYPGAVSIYPLVSGGELAPQALIDAIYETCNADDVRPLTDTVIVENPTKIEFNISLNVVLFDWADTTITTNLIASVLDAYKIAKYSQLGIDVVLSEITEIARVYGVYDVTVTQPLSNLVIAFNEFPFLVGYTINITGTNAG